MQIDTALEEATTWMDKYDEVVGVAEGKHENSPCITVFAKDLALADKIPKLLHGYRVVVELSDDFFAQKKH